MRYSENYMIEENIKKRLRPCRKILRLSESHYKDSTCEMEYLVLENGHIAVCCVEQLMRNVTGPIRSATPYTD